MNKIYALFLALLLFGGCQSAGSVHHPNAPLLLPPMPALTIQEKNVPVRMGTYSWSESGRGITVDSVDPPELVKDLEPVTVHPHATLHVDFRDKPLEIKAGLWENNGVTFKNLSDGTFTLPEDDGVYIGVIYASWQEGNATFVFKIQVQEGKAETESFG
ncbi:MAG: hypothetical protein BAA01_05770 [Bacillus thermozeamaize]|uniref:Lipoprotein n=1 Tax=Bacillus thermozeamaize TaxID=230954 RepID=A0A1Y3PEX3_9BACI|nr:MAG: hypothetical protein BAA01_05770 [Bacillus thermozeamaize]